MIHSIDLEQNMKKDILKNILELFKKTGFHNIKISTKEPYWCAVGYKK